MYGPYQISIVLQIFVHFRKKKKNIGIIISSWMNENFITNQEITHSNNQVGTQAIRLQMQSHNKILSKQSTQKS
jgi:hypothetical protein